jgi:hypothetical protein
MDNQKHCEEKVCGSCNQPIKGLFRDHSFETCVSSLCAERDALKARLANSESYWKLDNNRLYDDRGLWKSRAAKSELVAQRYREALEWITKNNGPDTVIKAREALKENE